MCVTLDFITSKFVAIFIFIMMMMIIIILTTTTTTTISLFLKYVSLCKKNSSLLLFLLNNWKISYFIDYRCLDLKVMRSDFKSKYSWGGRLVKRIYFPWIDGREVHYPTDLPNLAHVESLSQAKPHPDFFNLARIFGFKICHLGHHIGE